MDDYIISGAELTAIADAIRSKSGNTDSITPEDMPEEIMMLSIGSEPTLESIEVDPKTEIQTIKPSNGYQGLSQVTVNPIQTQEKITTTNGRVTPDDGKYLTAVTVNVPNNGVDTSDATATAADILKGTSAYVNGEKLDGTHVCEEGVDTSDATATAADIVKGKTAYADGGKLVGTHECDNADLGTKNIVLNGEYNAADDSLDGYSSVTVSVQPALQSLVTVTPDDTQHVIDPEDGYDGLRRVVVQPVQTETKLIEVNGTYTPAEKTYFSEITVRVPSSGVELPEFDPDMDIATETDVAKDKQFIDNNGNLLVGTHECDIADLGTKTITENGTYSAVNDGYDGYSSVTVFVNSAENGIGGVMHTEVTDFVVSSYKTNTGNSYSCNYGKELVCRNGRVAVAETFTANGAVGSIQNVIKGQYLVASSTIYYVPKDAVFTTSSSTNNYITTYTLKVDKIYKVVATETVVDTYVADAAASDIAVGKTAVVDGVLIEGTHECDVVNPVLESKTIQPSTQSITVVPSDGYDGLSQVVVEAMPTANQATPTITVDSDGKITATATQSAGYVVAGTKTATKQLTTKGATTITPSNTAQEIAAGTYLTGKQTISAVPTQEKTVVANGTVTPDAGKYLSKVTVNVPTSGIDTSDATATASDIAKDKTAYVNGIKITGNLNELKSGSAAYGTVKLFGESPDQSQLIIDTALSGDQLVREGGCVRTATELTEFGDADASDVANGKTFTSASGLKVTGTHVCEAGVELPELDSPGTASDLAQGKQLIDADGNIINGQLVALTSNAWLSNGYGTIYTSNDTDITIRTPAEVERIVRKNAGILTKLSLSEFGDATAADVVAGKTFTSAAGLVVTGTHECVGGLDTSDATATATDMAEGVTAYVNGEKVTGTLTTYGSDQINAFVEIVPTVKDDSVALSYVTHSDRIYRKGATIRFQSLKSQFGDATAADVAAGKTFTSAAGLKVTGTATGGDGAAIGTATTTPSSNATTITFTGLSAEPKMFTLLATNSFSVNNTTKYVTSITYNGQSIAGITTTRTGSYTSYAASHAYTSSYTWSYTNGTLTVTSSSASEGGNFRSGVAYHLTYAT